jgi:hypothetical protein
MSLGPARCGNERAPVHAFGLRGRMLEVGASALVAVPDAAESVWRRCRRCDRVGEPKSSARFGSPQTKSRAPGSATMEVKGGPEAYGRSGIPAE